MRSMKLLAATAVIAAFVAGPVMAESMTGMSSSSDTTMDAGKTDMKKAGKHRDKKHGKRHARKRRKLPSGPGTSDATSGISSCMSSGQASPAAESGMEPAQ